MKKLTALFLVFLLLTLTACRNTENLRGDVEDKNALRVYIDLSYADDDPGKTIHLDDFMFSLKESGGLESVVFEVIPGSGVERSSAITRIRTEIMAGGGPDVFITKTGFNVDYGKTLFPFPEKVMESGLFLPLDDYMENNTEFTEWDKQQPVVLAAGRNEEGQQIIPLSYSFPVQTCMANTFSMEPRDTLLTWQDTLTDPTLSAVYNQFNDCIEFTETYSVTDGRWERYETYPQYLTNILGRLADYKNEELLFTEEELMQRMDEILALQEDAVYDNQSLFQNGFMGKNAANSTTPMTFMPMYSDDGGITATIDCFAAVNRNTEYPEDAYRVIDVLLRKQTQLSKNLYVFGVCNNAYGSIPLHDDAFHKDSPFYSFSYFSDESYAAFTQVKEQITAANFVTSLHHDLMTLFSQYKQEEDSTTRKYLVRAAYESMQRKVRE